MKQVEKTAGQVALAEKTLELADAMEAYAYARHGPPPYVAGDDDAPETPATSAATSEKPPSP